MGTIRKKRILILNWRDTRHAEAGGAEVYAYELARRWKRAGHEVRMFCGNDGHAPRHEVVDEIEITRRGGFKTVYVWAFVYYMLSFRKHTDIIVDCHNGIPFFTPVYSRKPIYCVVHHVHQAVFREYLKPAQAMLASWLERTAMPYLYRNCQFITVSKSSKEGMVHELNIPAKHIEIVHNGIDLDRFVPGRKAEEPTILYMGRLKTYKSVDILIRAFVDIRASLPTARLVIGGSGDAGPGLKKLTKELGLESSVTFYGRVTEGKKVQLLQEAWAFCSPSYAEGWGITVIEAHACGTPVVASNVPGLRDSVQMPESGFLVPYGDVEAFSERLLYVLTNQKPRELMSRNARVWASRFDWQKSAMEFLETIENPSPL